jgi:hypothetical protein
LEERRATGARQLGRARRWKIGLARKPQEAKAFYATIVVATLVGTGISFSSIAPIKARALGLGWLEFVLGRQFKHANL